MPTTVGRNRRQYVINIRQTYTYCEKYDARSGGWVRADSEDAWHLLENRAARLTEEDDRSCYWITLKEQRYRLEKPVGDFRDEVTD